LPDSEVDTGGGAGREDVAVRLLQVPVHGRVEAEDVEHDVALWVPILGVEEVAVDLSGQLAEARALDVLVGLLDLEGVVVAHRPGRELPVDPPHVWEHVLECYAHARCRVAAPLAKGVEAPVEVLEEADEARDFEVVGKHVASGQLEEHVA